MKKLGTILEEAGVIDEIQLIRALSHQRKWRCRLGKSFVELGIVSEETIAKNVSQQLGIPYKEFDPKSTPQELLEIIPQDFARTKMFFPLGYYTTPEGNAIEIAMSDPTDEETLIKLEKLVGVKIWRIVARDSEIERAINDWERLKSTCRRSPNADELIESVKIKDESSLETTQPAHDEQAVEKERQETNESSLDEQIEESLPSPPNPQIPTDTLPQTDHAMSPEEILSVAGLPPIEEDISSLDMTRPEVSPSYDSYEQSTSNEEPARDAEEIEEPPEVFQSSQMWEETMPTEISRHESLSDTVPMESASEVSSLADNQVIEHTQAWEHIMPGVDVAAVDEKKDTSPSSSPVPVPHIPNEEPAVADEETQRSQQTSSETLLEEINQLKAQINLIRKEIKILKEALVKIKRGEI